MIADVASFLRYFEGVHRRTVRDVSSLPRDAESWTPPRSHDDESSWGVPEIVRHLAEARGFFAGAYVGDGWIWPAWPDPVVRKDSWVPALERSFDELVATLRAAPGDYLARKIEPIADDGPALSAWRTLMMMVEHEIHHRSQLATYAGLNDWPVHQLFGRPNEWVLSQREVQRNKRRRSS